MAVLLIMKYSDENISFGFEVGVDEFKNFILPYSSISLHLKIILFDFNALAIKIDHFTFIPVPMLRFCGACIRKNLTF